MDMVSTVSRLLQHDPDATRHQFLYAPGVLQQCLIP